MSFEKTGEGNEVVVGENVTLSGYIRGDNNRIHIASSIRRSVISLCVSGSNNEVSIGRMIEVNALQIAIGSHVLAHRAALSIGDSFSIGPNSQFLLYTSGNRLVIGRDCMFSKNVTVRCGESPHLIFDKNTGEFLDVSDGVVIGDHVWVGENTYLTKSAQIADECIVGACAVVTKKFTTPHVAVAGNPAKVVRENVQWLRNWGDLKHHPKLKESHDAFHAKFQA